MVFVPKLMVAVVWHPQIGVSHTVRHSTQHHFHSMCSSGEVHTVFALVLVLWHVQAGDELTPIEVMWVEHPPGSHYYFATGGCHR